MVRTIAKGRPRYLRIDWGAVQQYERYSGLYRKCLLEQDPDDQRYVMLIRQHRAYTQELQQLGRKINRDDGHDPLQPRRVRRKAQLQMLIAEIDVQIGQYNL